MSDSFKVYFEIETDEDVKRLFELKRYDNETTIVSLYDTIQRLQQIDLSIDTIVLDSLYGP